jgi:phosphotransferase system enzyme I (PtsI)
MIAMQGDRVSAGIASGPIRFYRKDAAEVCRRTVEDPAAESSPATRRPPGPPSSSWASWPKRPGSEAGDDAACLFETHQMMLEDLDYVAAIGDLIAAEHVNADFAVHETGRQFAAMFSAMDDEYMRARSADVLDISTRLERILRGETDGERAPTEPRPSSPPRT